MNKLKEARLRDLSGQAHGGPNSFRIGCIGRLKCAAHAGARWRQSPRFLAELGVKAPEIVCVSGRFSRSGATEWQERGKRKRGLPIKAHERMRNRRPKLVDAEERIEVRNPYTGAVVGNGSRAAKPGAGGGSLQNRQTPTSPKLTRYDRQKILTNAAEILSKRREGDCPSDHGPSPASASRPRCTKSARAYDVYPAGPARWRSATTSEVYFLRHHPPTARARRIYTFAPRRC